MNPQSLDDSSQSKIDLKELLKNNKWHYYVDFEVLNSVFRADIENIDVRNTQNSDDLVFMIGVGFRSDPTISTSGLLAQDEWTMGIHLLLC